MERLEAGEEVPASLFEEDFPSTVNMILYAFARRHNLPESQIAQLRLVDVQVKVGLAKELTPVQRRASDDLVEKVTRLIPRDC